MFDRVLVVDWSANARPKLGRDSIWIASGDVSTFVVDTRNHRTRAEAAERIGESVQQPGRTLIGVDFSLGYPAGFADAVAPGTGPAWRRTWDVLSAEVVDAADNANNRFEVAADLNERAGRGAGPFWGCPPTRSTSSLTTTKVAADPLAEWRAVEQSLRASGRRPFSSWQLLGAGSVGSQSLLGIPVLRRLVDALGDEADVWPFTCGLVVPARRVVIVEVWPALVALPEADGRVRDDLQVEAVAQWLIRGCASGSGVAWFTPDVPESLRGDVEGEEGWVLGA